MLPICQLFYVSSAAQPCDSESIQDILNNSRRNNRRLDVTGCLLFSGRCFAQVLEGEGAVVNALAQRIALDPRHQGAVVLMENYTTERQFADWSMGYLHDLDLEDKLETLVLGQETDPLVIADVMMRMKPDTVMGALR